MAECNMARAAISAALRPVTDAAGMTPGIRYDALWGRFLAVEEECLRLRQALREEEHQTERPGPEAHFAAFDTYEDSISESIKNKARDVFNVLLGIARKEFSPPGAEIEINEAIYEKRFMQPLWRGDRWKDFRPSAIWQALCDDLSGGRGIEMAYRKTAKNLVHGLGIEIGKPLERRNGQVILSASVWLDPYDKIDGKTKISRDSAERIRRLMQDVEAFANWAKLTMLAAGAATFRNTLGQDRTVISRKRLRMSDRMEVVTYHTRFEFCFNQAVAVKLQEFIVTHYPMKTENAA